MFACEGPSRQLQRNDTADGICHASKPFLRNFYGVILAVLPYYGNLSVTSMPLTLPTPGVLSDLL
jgi:hypothetical protein